MVVKLMATPLCLKKDLWPDVCVTFTYEQPLSIAAIADRVVLAKAL